VIAAGEQRPLLRHGQRRLALAQLPPRPQLDSELARLGTAGALGRLAQVLVVRQRVDGATRHVLDVERGALLELLHDRRIPAPGLERQPLERRAGAFTQWRQQPGGGARRFGPGRRSLEEHHRASPLGQLPGR